MNLEEVVEGGGLGPHADSIDGDDLSPVRQVDNGGGDSQETALVDVDHVQGQPHGHSASMALPPRRSTSRPAREALGWPETTTPLVPWIRGRRVTLFRPMAE